MKTQEKALPHLGQTLWHELRPKGTKPCLAHCGSPHSHLHVCDLCDLRWVLTFNVVGDSLNAAPQTSTTLPWPPVRVQTWCHERCSMCPGWCMFPTVAAGWHAGDHYCESCADWAGVAASAYCSPCTPWSKRWRKRWKNGVLNFDGPESDGGVEQYSEPR